MAVNDTDLVQEMTRARVSGRQIVIEAAIVEWPQVYEPHTSWVVVVKLPLSSTSAQIGAARSKLVKNRKFFVLCQECGKRSIKGHMHSAKICMGCAELNHGVIH